MTSCTAEPNRRVCSNPSPNSTPLTMLMLMTAAASAASSRRSQWTYEPRPIGSPWTTTSNTPPTVSPPERASSMRAIIAASASGSGQRSGDVVGLVARTGAVRRVDGDAADLGRERPDLDAELAQERPRDAAGRDACRGLARGRPLEDVADVVEAVLERAGQVGMPGSDPGHRAWRACCRPRRRRAAPRPPRR